MVTPKGEHKGAKYPNQIVNITSNYPHKQFEENEAPPPKLDAMAIQQISNNGQYLQKYEILTD